MRAYKILSFSLVILLIAVVFAGAVAVPAAAQYDTMQYRYNAAHTGDYSPVAGPVPSNGQLKWNYTTEGGVWSSPAVANGVVYVGSVDDNVYAINATTGAKLWNYTTRAAVLSSPAVANGTVYVGDYESVYALNATTSAKLWNYTTGDYLFSSPAVANGVVYMGSADYNVYALNASTGAKLWNYTTGGAIDSSPAFANGVVYVGSRDDNVYAINATTGTKLWNFKTGDILLSSPAFAKGVVYVGSVDDNVYAIGTESVSKQTELSLSGVQIHVTSSSPPAKVAITYAFSGTLTTTQPKPVGIANAKIYLQWSKDNTNWSPATPTPAVTNANGAYVFKGSLAPGTYYFRTAYNGSSSYGASFSRVVKVSVSSTGSSVVSYV
jgi:outer membrane protein assembly factor BamB